MTVVKYTSDSLQGEKNLQRQIFHHKLAEKLLINPGTCLGSVLVECFPHVSDREGENSKV